MANSKRRISELPPLNVATLDTTFVLGISGSTTYKISINQLTSSLDTTFATDLVTSALSGTIDTKLSTSSFNQYTSSVTASVPNGTISGSSQLTSSFDTRYVLSGSITQTTWDNISGKPSGLVSQSTDLSSLNSFTQSIDNRVDSLESWSSSLDSTFATDLQVSIVSSSVAATIGVISQNTGLVSTSSFNSYTASQSTSSLVNRLNSIESVSGSWITESETGSFLTNLNGAISASSQITALGFISSSDSITSLNSYTSSLKGAIELTGSTVSFLGNIIVYGTQSVITSTNVELSDNILYLSPTASTDNDLGIVGHYNDGIYRHAGIFMDASDGHSWKVFNGLQTETTATVDTNGTGFTLADFKAGTITGTSFNGIINATNGVVSGSSQLTSSFDTRYAISASYLTSLNGTISSSIQILGGSGIYSSSAQLPLGLISGSSQLTASFDTRYTLSGSVQPLPSGLISGSSQLTSSFDTIYLTIGGDNVISGSSQLTASFDTRYAASGSGGSLPSGVISGSSQITGIVNLTNLSATSQVSASVFVGGFGVPEAKFTVISNKAMTFWPNISTEAVRFTTGGGVLIGHNGGVNDFGNKLDVSGSIRIWGTTTLTGSVMVVNGLTGSIAATNGIVSGSTQILNYNILATTGSNSFNGNQTITGSLNVSSVAVVSSSFTANSSSLTLNSGSNLYIQNNGIVEITGSLLVSGSNNINLVSPVLQIGTGSGDEGGEILLAKAITNTTLAGTGVTVDVYRDRIRIFEQGGDARGVYIDLAKTPTGVAGELMWKASGIVNAGTFVTLDNIKAQVPASGNRGLSLATVSGTVTGYISGQYQGISNSSSGTSTTTSLSTTASSSIFSWNFGQQGDMSTYILRDDTNNRVYRIILIIGGSYNNNFISIERLH